MLRILIGLSIILAMLKDKLYLFIKNTNQIQNVEGQQKRT